MPAGAAACKGLGTGIQIGAQSPQRHPLKNRLIGLQITGSELIIIERTGYSLIWSRPDELIRVTEEFVAA
jgi:hypothetical protein